MNSLNKTETMYKIYTEKTKLTYLKTKSRGRKTT